MALLAVGINHATAPVSMRERVAFAPERQTEALHALLGQTGIREAAILSTCNRTEIYCGQNEPGQEVIIDWLEHFHGLEHHRLEPYIYAHPEQAAVRHMLRVACGLDSMVLGEPQILGQMKSAYQAASSAGSLGHILDRLFQHTFLVAKQVRTDTRIGANPVSVAYAAVTLAQQIFGDLGSKTALLVGAGDTIELTARHLHQQGLKRLIVANRTAERARDLAARYSGYAITLDEIPDHLAEVDMVVSSTGCPTPVITRETVKTAFTTRKHRPMFLVDIAVPRDIEPSAGDLEDVYLYSIDDLQGVIKENQRSRQIAAGEAEEIIDVQTERFMAWVRSLNSVDTIVDLRTNAETMRDEVLARAQRLLAAGKPADEVLDRLAHTLTNKLLHRPSTRLRDAGAGGDETLLTAARQLFALKKRDRKSE